MITCITILMSFTSVLRGSKIPPCSSLMITSFRTIITTTVCYMIMTRSQMWDELDHREASVF